MATKRDTLKALRNTHVELSRLTLEGIQAGYDALFDGVQELVNQQDLLSIHGFGRFYKVQTEHGATIRLKETGVGSEVCSNAKLAEYVYFNSDLTKRQCTALIVAVLKDIKIRVQTEGKVAVYAVGHFYRAKLTSRRMKTPKLQRIIQTQAKEVMRFKAAPCFKDGIN